MINIANNYTHWSDTKSLWLSGVLVFSGVYTTGGDNLNFASLNNPSIKTGATRPRHVDIVCTSPYVARYIPGTTLASGLVKVYNLTTGLEISAGAYPADLLSDTWIKILANFKKYVDLG